MLATHVGDIVVGCCPCIAGCCPTTAVVASGDPRYIDNGTPRSRVGDIVAFPCGASVIVTGLPTEICSGTPVSTLGSVVSGAGQGIVVTGIPNHIKV